jgi:hypothetical protein
MVNQERNVVCSSSAVMLRLTLWRPLNLSPSEVCIPGIVEASRFPAKIDLCLLSGSVLD